MNAEILAIIAGVTGVSLGVNISHRSASVADLWENSPVVKKLANRFRIRAL